MRGRKYAPQDFAFEAPAPTAVQRTVFLQLHFLDERIRINRERKVLGDSLKHNPYRASADESGQSDPCRRAHATESERERMGQRDSFTLEDSPTMAPDDPSRLD